MCRKHTKGLIYYSHTKEQLVDKFGIHLMDASRDEVEINANVAMLTNAASLLDIVQQYLDGMKGTLQEGSIAWMHAKSVYEQATKAKYE